MVHSYFAMGLKNYRPIYKLERNHYVAFCNVVGHSLDDGTKNTVPDTDRDFSRGIRI